MEHDPLRETLDGLLSTDAPAPEAASAPVPAAIESVCRALAEERGVADVRLGRQVCIASHQCHLPPLLMQKHSHLSFALPYLVISRGVAPSSSRCSARLRLPRF